MKRESDFHTFTWEQRKLGECLNVNSGKDYKSLKRGNIPVYGTGGYMCSVDQALSYNEDAIGIGRKGTINKPYILKAPFWTVDTLFYIVPKAKLNLFFMYLIFQKVNWKRKDESTGVPSLSKSIIKSVKELFPKGREQNEIAELFEILDTTIALHQRNQKGLQNRGPPIKTINLYTFLYQTR
ncbi:restriction endonuclease subunit S [Pediococcus acidilactici]|uniref:restriction endonuclease subunit S n=1 Tax=Pediococcus acidilactici TaxID=1254 RepID=UPI001ED8F7CD|nr:restriction endonuclease subunit S [Pediococcus acidilactici]MDB8865155.1 restriction endonuclease subunit S [Pediococcus acidilactici]MDB8872788.1 restriction endonuclease subunit S [Pediococcus acidilactici]UPU33950.1 restriction endonuclease subunit S [Pediococcus acidilactici]